MPFVRRCLTLALLVLVALPVHARAESPNQAARRHFLAGSQHFDLQEYAAALVEFKEAYRIKEDPVFLFNIAQCHRIMGDKEEALRSYKTYLARSPTASNRADVESKIGALEHDLQVDRDRKAAEAERDRKLTEERAEQERVASAQAAAAAALVAQPVKPKKPVYKQWWLWTAVGAGVLVVGLGVGLGVGLSRAKSEPLFPNVTF